MQARAGSVKLPGIQLIHPGLQLFCRISDPGLIFEHPKIAKVASKDMSVFIIFLREVSGNQDSDS